jgi:tagatose 6-phosphate kinase
LNVAAVLTQLGVPVVTTGLLRGGPPTFTPVAGAPRRTVVVTDGQDATGFWEPGPRISAAEWAAFRTSYRRLVRDARVVVLAGSLPPGVPETGYAELVTVARAAGVRSILDTSGPALALGVAAGPDVVKPNAQELADLRAGSPPAANTIVVASDGANGLRAAGWRVRPPRRLAGNPTGAGDACVAALARGLLAATAWPELLRDAVALSAAAVATPVAGHVDLPLYHRLRTEVVAEEAP